MKLYDNEKQYVESNTVDMSMEGMTVIKQMKEKTPDGYTGFINSLVIFKVPVYSWINAKELFDANTKELQINLFKFASLSTDTNQLECWNLQYSWYTMTFSYQIDKDVVYGGQYLFMDDETLYLLSLNSMDMDDIKKFVKSLKTLVCIE